MTIEHVSLSSLVVTETTFSPLLWLILPNWNIKSNRIRLQLKRLGQITRGARNGYRLFICSFHCPHGSFGLHKVHWTHLTGHQQHPLSQNRWQSSQNRLAISNSNKIHLTFVPLIISSIFVTLPDVVLWGKFGKASLVQKYQQQPNPEDLQWGKLGDAGGVFRSACSFWVAWPYEV